MDTVKHNWVVSRQVAKHTVASKREAVACRKLVAKVIGIEVAEFTLK